MTKSKTGYFALGFFAFAALFIIIAFGSPYWLVTDGKLKDSKFLKIGKNRTYVNVNGKIFVY